jgi:NADPH-dependent ferric siderophore reductase
VAGYYQDYFRAEVRAVEQVSAHMLRVVLGGGDLQRFRTSGFGDERLLVVFPPRGASAPPPPVRVADGTLDYPDRATCPPMRSYTVRGWDADAGEMLIDFVLHPGGVAAPWAIRARRGDVVYVTEAGGWHAPPPSAQWQVLLADMTGLPALGRILEESRHGLPTLAIAEVPETTDRQDLVVPTGSSVQWLTGTGNGLGPSQLRAALGDLDLPGGPGYVWFAGEASESRSVRKYLRGELGWTADHFTILGYWRIKQEEWLARYTGVGDRLESIYAEALAAGRSENDAADLYDRALEKAGL